MSPGALQLDAQGRLRHLLTIEGPSYRAAEHTKLNARTGPKAKGRKPKSKAKRGGTKPRRSS